MLTPSKYKHKKEHRPRFKTIAYKGSRVIFGEWGIKSLEFGAINNRQIESVRRVLIRKIRGIGKIWIRIFPNRPVTEKPVGVKMGKGVGKIERFCFYVKPGTIMFEFSGVNKEQALSLHRKASDKLSVKTRFSEKI